MTTFSQLVDDMVTETKRPDMRADFAKYLNQTIRECHFDPETNNAIFLIPNYREAQVTTDSETGYYWPIPDVTVFQGLMAVRFDDVYSDGLPVFAVGVIPGRRGEVLYGYQRAGDIVLFNGYGGVGATISIAYYEYPKSLKYHASGSRPAEYDLENGWTYSNAYDDSDELKETARNLVTNWLLLRWPMVLEEGLRAKVYKRLSDDGRQRVSYSLYMQQRKGLITSEQADISGAF